MSRTIAATALVGMLATASAQECVPLVDAASKAGLTSLIDFTNAIAEALPGDDRVQEILTTISTDEFATEDRITLFAPNSKAFDDIASVAATLPAETLLSVLLNHVVGAELKASDVVAAIKASAPVPASVMSKVDLPLDIFSADGGLFVTPAGSDIDSKIVEVDIETCIGTIHIIDAVLIPTAEPAPVLLEKEAGLYGEEEETDGAYGAVGDIPSEQTPTRTYRTTTAPGDEDADTIEDSSSSTSSGGVSGATIGLISGGAVAAVLAGLAAFTVYKRQAPAAVASSAALSV